MVDIQLSSVLLTLKSFALKESCFFFNFYMMGIFSVVRNFKYLFLCTQHYKYVFANLILFEYFSIGNLKVCLLHAKFKVSKHLLNICGYW